MFVSVVEITVCISKVTDASNAPLSRGDLSWVPRRLFKKRANADNCCFWAVGKTLASLLKALRQPSRLSSVWGIRSSWCSCRRFWCLWPTFIAFMQAASSSSKVESEVLLHFHWSFFGIDHWLEFDSLIWCYKLTLFTEHRYLFWRQSLADCVPFYNAGSFCPLIR